MDEVHAARRGRLALLKGEGEGPVSARRLERGQSTFCLWVPNWFRLKHPRHNRRLPLRKGGSKNILGI